MVGLDQNVDDHVDQDQPKRDPRPTGRGIVVTKRNHALITLVVTRGSNGFAPRRGSPRRRGNFREETDR